MAVRLNKQEVLARLKASEVVAILRAESPDGLIEVAQALARGGVEFVEITLTVPGALAVISHAACHARVFCSVTRDRRSSAGAVVRWPSSTWSTSWTSTPSSCGRVSSATNLGAKKMTGVAVFVSATAIVSTVASSTHRVVASSAQCSG